MNTMRRKEFNDVEEAVAWEVLDRSRFGHLGTVDASGLPEVRPMNFVRHGGHVYFHAAEGGSIGQQMERPASFCVQDTLAWIPSYWRHPEMACPASTYYRSVMVRGCLRPVHDLEEKAVALSGFMEKYQPEGGHLPIRGDDPRYIGPLKALRVFALPLESWSCKVKMGQHLQPAARRTVYEGLLSRALTTDVACARVMLRTNPDLAVPTSEDPSWIDDPCRIPADELWLLLRSTYWAAERDLPTVQRHLEEADAVTAGLRDGRLVAYARACCIERRLAWIYDVVVHPDDRGRGLGREVMQRLLSHPRLRHVGRIFLDTRDAMAFYRTLGFVELHRRPKNGGSSLMVLDRECTALMTDD